MITRRQFIIGSAAVAGGLAVGYRVRESSLPRRLPPSIPLAPGETALTPYVVVDPSGITIITPRAEMGQGIHTTLAALVAEELEVDPRAVRTAHGPASEHYSNQFMFGPRPYPGRVHPWPTQSTIAQSSIRDAFDKMRRAGAGARHLLLQAAAQELDCSPDDLRTEAGTVLAPDGRRRSYERLAERAAGFRLPENPPLKPRSEWRLLGRSQPRVDMVPKCTGTAEYALDVSLPDLLYASIRRNPHIDAPVDAMDTAVAESMPGVEKIVPIRDGAIVIASNTWYAMEAAKRIEFQWSAPDYPLDTRGHRSAVRAAFDEEPYVETQLRGGAEDSHGDATLSGEYSVPYLSHATMEPMNATALFGEDRIDVWVGNQAPTRARQIAARVSSLPIDRVHIHTTYMGGGFGRRFELYEVKEAVIAAMAMRGRPVRLIYPREEDLTHDAYRPMAAARFDAVLADGVPVRLDLELSVPSLHGSAARRQSLLLSEPDQGTPAVDESLTMGAVDQPYAIENHRVAAYLTRQHLPVGWWRSVGESQNAFFMESIMDELAHAAGRDPLEMRLDLLTHAPSVEVLRTLADLSGWGSPLPEGHGRGLAYSLSSDAATAQVIEVQVTEDRVELIRAFAVVDVGIALDPRNLESQVQGSLMFGLSAAIFGEVTVAAGAVQERNFDTYPMLRLHQAPPIQLAIIESGREIFGAGECATATAAPALGNAIFSATGQRIRDLPFSRHLTFV